MPWYYWLALLALSLYPLHHLLLWMEREGWIYYRHSGSGASQVMLVVDAALQPGKEHVLVQKQEEKKECSEDEDGEDGPPRF